MGLSSGTSHFILSGPGRQSEGDRLPESIDDGVGAPRAECNPLVAVVTLAHAYHPRHQIRRSEIKPSSSTTRTHGSLSLTEEYTNLLPWVVPPRASREPTAPDPSAHPTMKRRVLNGVGGYDASTKLEFNETNHPFLRSLSMTVGATGQLNLALFRQQACQRIERAMTHIKAPYLAGISICDYPGR